MGQIVYKNYFFMTAGIYTRVLILKKQTCCFHSVWMLFNEKFTYNMYYLACDCQACTWVKWPSACACWCFVLAIGTSTQLRTYDLIYNGRYRHACPRQRQLTIAGEDSCDRALAVHCHCTGFCGSVARYCGVTQQDFATHFGSGTMCPRLNWRVRTHPTERTPPPFKALGLYGHELLTSILIGLVFE